jgi:hypothetical protein
MPGTASRGVCAKLQVPCARLKKDTPPGGAAQWSLVAGLQVVAEKLRELPAAVPLSSGTTSMRRTVGL